MGIEESVSGVIWSLFAPILQSSSPAVTALLLILAIGFGWIIYKLDFRAKSERNELIGKFQLQIDEDRKDLLQVIEKYQEGQISVVEALNEIRVLIATIGGKL